MSTYIKNTYKIIEFHIKTNTKKKFIVDDYTLYS
jgi:hypothetical protein